MALNLDAWDTAPHRVAVNGRRVRVALLVIPPQATTAAAGIAMATAADVLAAAGIGGQDPGPMSPQQLP